MAEFMNYSVVIIMYKTKLDVRVPEKNTGQWYFILDIWNIMTDYRFE